MEKYIKESLAAGIIRPSSSPVGAGFIFVFEDDGAILNRILKPYTFTFSIIQGFREKSESPSVISML